MRSPGRLFKKHWESSGNKNIYERISSFLMSAGRVTSSFPTTFPLWVLPSLQQLGLINYGVHIFCNDLPREADDGGESSAGKWAAGPEFPISTFLSSTHCMLWYLKTEPLQSCCGQELWGEETFLLWSLLSVEIYRHLKNSKQHLPCANHYAKHLMWIISFNPYGNSIGRCCYPYFL